MTGATVGYSIRFDEARSAKTRVPDGGHATPGDAGRSPAPLLLRRHGGRGARALGQHGHPSRTAQESGQGIAHFPTCQRLT